MKNRILVLGCAILTVGLAAWAGTKSYTVTILDPVMAGATELPAGEYQVSIANDKAMLHKGKFSAENPVRVESADAKYGTTSVVLATGDGKMRIKEIHLGGTKTKLVFTETQP